MGQSDHDVGVRVYPVNVGFNLRCCWGIKSVRSLGLSSRETVLQQIRTMFCPSDDSSDLSYPLSAPRLPHLHIVPSSRSMGTTCCRCLSDYAFSGHAITSTQPSLLRAECASMCMLRSDRSQQADVQEYGERCTPFEKWLNKAKRHIQRKSP